VSTYLVWSGATGGTNTGTEAAGWDNAFLAFNSALAAATVDGDVIKIHKTHDDNQSLAVTYTLLANINIFCVDKDAGDALSTGAVLGSISGPGVNVSITGSKTAYFNGVTTDPGIGTGNGDTSIGAADNAVYTFENSTFRQNNNSNTDLNLGFSHVGANSRLIFRKCSFYCPHLGNVIALRNKIIFEDCSLSGVPLAEMFQVTEATGNVTFIGCDLSLGGTTLFNTGNNGGYAIINVINCKLPTGTTLMSTPASIAAAAHCEAYFYNCSAGDIHYNFYHFNGLGETVAFSTIFANDGASYDGQSRVSWKISTTANCSFFTPYVSPWIDAYHSGMAPISPTLECVRSGSAVPYKNSEVWSDISVQATAGSTQSTIYSDRCVVAVDPTTVHADQSTGALTSSGWYGQDPTSAYMKLGIDAGSTPTTVTPQRIGHVRMRICVGKTLVSDLYVDPYIRGLE